MRYGNTDALVHAGFYNAWLRVRHDVVVYTEDAAAFCRGCHIASTGHSLGAAISGRLISREREREREREIMREKSRDMYSSFLIMSVIVFIL